MQDQEKEKHWGKHQDWLIALFNLENKLETKDLINSDIILW